MSCTPKYAALGDISQYNAGLPPKVGIISDIDTFGDSGDVFAHVSWRNLFDFLASNEKTRHNIVAMASQILLRGKVQKIESRGKSIQFTLDLTGLDTAKLEKGFGIKATGSLTFNLVYATESTRVPAKVLTPEKLKCIIRNVAVPAMMTAGRMAATSSAIGFDIMAKDLKKVNELALLNAKTEETAYTGKSWKEIVEDCGMDEELLKQWDNLLETARDNSVSSWIKVSSMSSASVTQKEIYQIDLDCFPGTILWAGVHTMMTDVANKRKAVEVTADLRARYENSNFYGDFKRKQLPRNLITTKTDAYINCLKACGPLMARYLKASTGVSSAEVTAIDFVTNEVNKKYNEATEKYRPKSGGTTSDDPQVVQQEILKKVNKVAEKIA